MNNFFSKSYKDFNESDFICDPFFQDWIIKPNEESEKFWNEFLSAYPEKKDVVEYARFFLKNLQFKYEFPNENHIKSRFDEHFKAVNNTKGAKVVRLNSAFLKKMSRIAVIAGIVLIASVIFLLRKKPLDATVATNYGE